MNKLRVFIIILLLGGATGAAIHYIRQRYQEAPVPITETTEPEGTIPDIKPSGGSTTTPAGSTQSPTPTPATLLLPVPFTPQAPTANWDTLHNEACEEASAIMASEYFSGNHDSRLEASEVERQITKLTDWEMSAFGYNLDITSEETVRMIKENYGLNAEMVTNYSAQSIKQALAQGRLVLFPANGQMLGNPNFKQPGPKYHMVVVRGYTATTFVTNDPGTRNGLNYPYTYETLRAANGNFNHASDSVDLNSKNIILVWK